MLRQTKMSLLEQFMFLEFFHLVHEVEGVGLGLMTRLYYFPGIILLQWKFEHCHLSLS